MMNCEMGLLHSFGVLDGACVSLEIRGELAIAALLRAAHLYSVGPWDPDHDAVMRIGGKAPGGGPILLVGIKCHVRIRGPATSDRQFGNRAEANASAEQVRECSSGRSACRTQDDALQCLASGDKAPE